LPSGNRYASVADFLPATALVIFLHNFSKVKTTLTGLGFRIINEGELVLRCGLDLPHG
jgi:hypothetical protein